MRLAAEGEIQDSHLAHQRIDPSPEPQGSGEAMNQVTPQSLQRVDNKPSTLTILHSHVKLATSSLLILFFVIFATFSIALITAIVVAPYNDEKIKYIVNYPLDGAITALLIAYLVHQLIFKRGLRPNSRKARFCIHSYHVFVILLSAVFEGGVGYKMSSYIQQNGYRVIAMKLITISFTFVLYAFFLAINALHHGKDAFKNSNKVIAINNNESQVQRSSLNPILPREDDSSVKHKRNPSSLMDFDNANRLDRTQLPEGLSPKQAHSEEPHHQRSLPLMFIGLTVFMLTAFSQFCGSLVIGGFFDSLMGQQTVVNVSVCLLYPITMMGFKIGLTIVDKVLKLDLEEYIELISLPFAALPYRTLYFRVDEPELAGAIILIKVIYKSIVYILFANIIHITIPLTTRLQAKVMSCITKRKRKSQVDKEFLHKKVEEKIEQLAKGFQVLQFSDIYMNLAVVAIAYIVKWIRPDHQLLTTADGDQLPTTTEDYQYSIFLKFAFIEASVDTAIWIIVLLIWKFCARGFKGFHFLKIFKEFLHEAWALYILVNWTLFTVIFLILSL